jgi:enoyl-[acyl-carrier protein] reductase I
MGFLAGKRAVIVGLASNRSIAFGIAEAMRREGAALAFSYQGDKLAERVTRMAGDFGSDLCLPLDVGVDAEIEAFFDGLAARWDGFDILVHSVAFAPADQLEGRYIDAVNREGFRIAHDISSYSFAALARKAESCMAGRNGALLTLTYLGAVRALPSYNVMGLAKASLEANVRFLALDLGPKNIRVNAISAGPIKTLAARGVSGITKMVDHHKEFAPLRRATEQSEVGDTALFLVSSLSRGITGEVIYVDEGYHIMGLTASTE